MIEIIKKFRDGSLLVTKDGVGMFMSQQEYDTAVTKGFDIEKFIIDFLSEKFDHCKFAIDGEYVCMDGIDIAKISVDTVRFWINEQGMSVSEAKNYILENFIPSIVESVASIEFDRCKNNIKYFVKHYVKL